MSALCWPPTRHAAWEFFSFFFFFGKNNNMIQIWSSCKNNSAHPTALLTANVTWYYITKLSSLIVLMEKKQLMSILICSLCMCTVSVFCLCIFENESHEYLGLLLLWRGSSRGLAPLSWTDRVMVLTDDASLWHRRAWADGWPVLPAGTNTAHQAEMKDAVANFKHRKLNRSILPLSHSMKWGTPEWLR